LPVSGLGDIPKIATVICIGVIMQDDVWSVRKTIGFKSEKQYERYRQAGKKRGLTTARFLSWVAESFIKFDECEGDEEVTQGTEAGMTHIHVVCSKEERDSVKRLAQERGVSMGHLLLSSVKSGGKKQIDCSGVLAALTLCEYHVEFEDLESARKQLEILKGLLDKAKKGEEDGRN
jgi:hypothetical protein